MYIHSTKREALWLVAYSNPARVSRWIAWWNDARHLTDQPLCCIWKIRSIITNSEGAVDSCIGWWRCKKLMISRCSSYAAADDYWASGTDYDAAAPLSMLVCSKKPYFLLQKYLGFLFCEKWKNSLAPQWYEIPTKAIYWHVFKNLTHMLLVLY